MEQRTPVVPTHTLMGEIRPYLSGESAMVYDRLRPELEGDCVTAYWRSAASYAQNLRALGWTTAADEIDRLVNLFETLPA